MERARGELSGETPPRLVVEFFFSATKSPSFDHQPSASSRLTPFSFSKAKTYLARAHSPLYFRPKENRRSLIKLRKKREKERERRRKRKIERRFFVVLY